VGAGEAAAAGPPPRPTLVATLGDGVTAGSPGYDPDPALRKALGFGSDAKSQWQYWAARAHPGLVFRNCGVWGERTDQLARRLVACARGAQALVVEGGLADVEQRRPVARAAADLRRIVVRAKALGLRVAVCEVLPWSNGWPDADRPIRRLNALIHRIGRQERVPVLPFYETLEDPARPGRVRLRWTADGTYPSVEGYRRLGERAFRAP